MKETIRQRSIPLQDVSREAFGKYQYCTKVNGKWYSDEDFMLGGGCGPLKRGAIPAPEEKDRTPYEPTPPRSAFQRFLAWLRGW